MAKVGTAIAIVLTLLAALVGMSSCARAGEISDAIRIVPQLELTDLHPVKVAFAPDDDALLLIVNINGRVDIFDVSNPGAPAKITEILANANDAAFASTRTKREKIGVVSGGDDGTVRLWTLDGKPAAEPFKGHDGSVHSVAFSADGTRIVSGGQDGTVRLWNIASRSHMLVDSSGNAIGLGFVEAKFFWILCSDRIRLESTAFEPRGELFFSDEGLAALVYDEGVYVPSDRLKQPFRTIVPIGQVIWQHGSLPELPAQRVKQVLLDDWTWRERLIDTAMRNYAHAHKALSDLSWWNAAFWPVLAWAAAIVLALVAWVAAPHRLAHLAMRSTGRPDVPQWKWLSDILLLFGYLGTTRRPLEAWLRKHRAGLLEQNFTGRDPVKERQTYADLTHKQDIERLAAIVSGQSGGRVWVTGTGGSGKSALAYRILRAASKQHRTAPLPVLIDEDWDGAIAEHVAKQLMVGDRCPTAKMVGVLGSRNRICPLIDQLSERGTVDAVKRVAEAVESGAFRSVVVTSRKNREEGKVWETFETLVVRPLTAAEVPDYVNEYAPEGRREHVTGVIAPLIAGGTAFSPLFLRFAIEQALKGEATATSTRDLVLQYVEALRKGRLDLDADDMLRAAAIAATESLRDTLAPRETEPAYLKGVLVTEADVLPFMNAKRDKVVVSAELIEMLVACGLLNRNQINRRLQFAYDPVAEHLFAWRATQGAAAGQAVPLRERVRASPDTALARTVADYEEALDPISALYASSQD